jgi:hypothetical protein
MMEFDVQKEFRGRARENSFKYRNVHVYRKHIGAFNILQKNISQDKIPKD